MNVLHLSAADHGGAGIAAWRMHDSLRRLGHRSHVWVLERKTGDADVRELGSGSFRWRRLATKAALKLATRPAWYFQEQRLSAGIGAADIADAQALKPDVIVVHFISHFLAPGDVLALQESTGAPVLWNLLDMGLLTGGCHYAWDCPGYTRTCGSCPALRISGPNDASARIWRAKHDAVVRTRGWVVAGSSWLARQAAGSSLFEGRHIETLLLGVSPLAYAPGEQNALRAELGAPGAERVVFFGAQRFDQKRKGMHLLMKALVRLAETWPRGVALPVLLCAGNAADFSRLRERGYTLVELGFVGGMVLAKAYAAADLFACPSIEDSGPMMINESMMCGTPVVAFRMGVAEDLIENGLSGAIATLGDTQAFTDALEQVLLWPAERRDRARARCRDVALQKCSPDRQLERFVTIAEACARDADRVPA